MDKLFTKEEFSNHVFKSNKPTVFDKEFLKKWNNKDCIKSWEAIMQPLTWAARNGYLRVVRYLVENNADVIVDDNRAVRWAAADGHLDVIKYLIQNDADISSRNDYAMRSAALKGYPKIVKYLVENGADLTANNNFAIRWAVAKNRIEVVKYILSTFIYSEDFIHNLSICTDPRIKDLLANYKQFSSTKAVKIESFMDKK